MSESDYIDLCRWYVLGKSKVYRDLKRHEIVEIVGYKDTKRRAYLKVLSEWPEKNEVLSFTIYAGLMLMVVLIWTNHVDILRERMGWLFPVILLSVIGIVTWEVIKVRRELIETREFLEIDGGCSWVIALATVYLVNIVLYIR